MIIPFAQNIWTHQSQFCNEKKSCLFLNEKNSTGLPERAVSRKSCGFGPLAATSFELRLAPLIGAISGPQKLRVVRFFEIWQKVLQKVRFSAKNMRFSSSFHPFVWDIIFSCKFSLRRYKSYLKKHSLQFTCHLRF